MRALIVTGLLAASLILSACEKKIETAAAPAAPDYDGRSQQMYQGQEHLLKITAATIERGTKPGELLLKASVDAPAPGYANLVFLPRIYAAQPKDGIYEVDVAGDAPAGGATQVLTPVEVKGGWSKFSDERVKGVKFIAKTNDLTAMVPPAK